MPKKSYIRKYQGRDYDIRNLPVSLVYDRKTRRIRKRKTPYVYKFDKPKLEKRKNYQIEVPGTNIKVDEKRKAMPPGKRRSKSGRFYTETRENRSDANQRKRL